MPVDQIPNSGLDYQRNHFVFEDDFTGGLVSGDKWLISTSVDGSGAVADAAGGIVTLKSAVASAGNEEVILVSSDELFLFAAGKPIFFEAELLYTELDVNDANIFVGLMNAGGTAPMVNGGAGPKANASGMGFYKTDGSTAWATFASVGTTQHKEVLTASNSNNLTGLDVTSGGGVRTILQVQFRPLNSTTAEVLFTIHTPTLGWQLVHKVSSFVFTNATEMNVVVAVKDGAAAAAGETVSLDRVWVSQKR